MSIFSIKKTSKQMSKNNNLSENIKGYHGFKIQSPDIETVLISYYSLTYKQYHFRSVYVSLLYHVIQYDITLTFVTKFMGNTPISKNYPFQTNRNCICSSARCMHDVLSKSIPSRHSCCQYLLSFAWLISLLGLTNL